MPTITTVTALRSHMRGQKVAGLDGRTYEVNRTTGLLHFIHGGLPVDEPRVHSDDVAEFKQFASDFAIGTASTEAPPAPAAHKAPPPPPVRKAAPVAAEAPAAPKAPEEPVAPPTPPKAKRADERALPAEAAAWSHARLLSEATSRGIKLSAKERSMHADKLFTIIADKVGVAEIEEDRGTEDEDAGEE